MLASIKQVCVRRSTSVSHSMARLPVWSPAWGNIELTRLADLDGSCALLTLLVFFLSSCFLFFFPVRTCTSSFSGLKGSGNVVIGRRDVLALPLNITFGLHFTESACSAVNTSPWISALTFSSTCVREPTVSALFDRWTFNLQHSGKYETPAQQDHSVSHSAASWAVQQTSNDTLGHRTTYQHPPNN